MRPLPTSARLLPLCLTVALQLFDLPPAAGVQPPATAVHLEVQASSWRARGRVSFPVAPTLRMRLAEAGFRVVSKADDPHDLVVRVEYREERGDLVTLDISGTEVHCTIAVEEVNRGPLLTFTLHERPGYGRLATLPYLDVIYRLETNPYFYFLGELIKETLAGVDITEALIRTVTRTAAEADQPSGTASDSLGARERTLPSFGPQYRAAALEKGVVELGRLGDPRAVPALLRLLEDRRSTLRLEAVSAMAHLDLPEAAAALRRVAQDDPDVEVREAARGAVERTGAPRGPDP